MRDKRFALWVVGLAAALLAVWWNHFGNGFHFDDFHTVTDNAAIRSLSNIPRFFSDGRTFSVVAENQGWRPLVSTTLAVDYWLAGGTDGRLFYFHLSTFLAFSVQLGCMFVLFRHLFDAARPTVDNRFVALFAVAVYGLHPVCAETVNYIIQRADVYVALGFVASMAIYAAWPRGRWTAIYLVPFLLASMAKPTALVFPLVLAAYLLLFEDGRLRNMLPALIAALAMALMHKRMTPPTYVFGGADPYSYRITQPVVAFHYIREFFWPSALSADTDWASYTSLANPAVIASILFIAALIAVAVYSARRPLLRPIAFGIAWFFITFLPTAVAPLAEVTNDHRMFLPMIGTTLAVVWTAALLLQRWPRAAVTLGLIALVALGTATVQRNRVWATEATLWVDVVEKSPSNGRGWMNYGLTFMRVGDYDRALQCFNRAKQYTPNYSHLEINLGIASGAMGRDEEAEGHFQRARQLDGTSGRPQFYHARWLHGRKRDAEAIAELKDGLHRNPYDMPSRDLLLEIYHDQHDWAALETLIEETRRVTPDDTVVNAYASMDKNERGGDITAAEQKVKQSPSAEGWLDLSLAYHKAGRFQEEIGAARHALALRPDYPEAWNNIAAAYLDLHQWDDAIAAADRAIALNPNFQLARNNRAYAEEQKKASTK